MREIIQLHAGQCGNLLGSALWDMLADEHGVDYSGNYIDTVAATLHSYYQNVYFYETKKSVLCLVQSCLTWNQDA